VADRVGDTRFGFVKQVVGAAIVRHGCVLAARRTAPVAAAGRWEFPGGKVESGETAEAALVRELDEELGCTVAVTGWLADAVQFGPSIGDSQVLTVALASLVDGEPVPVEHDQLRWLAPEELGDVDWLEPDRPFLDELREVLLDGEHLEGGNVGGAVRIGATVRRPVGPWSPAVHALLDHLKAVGVAGVPRVHGHDARGREVLDFLPGEVLHDDPTPMSPDRLTAIGRWTRDFHDAVAGFRHDGPWRFLVAEEPTLVAHNDIAPYNIAFEGEQIVGVFDWDTAGPSTPLLELAHVAWNCIPMWSDLPPELAAERLEILATAYGRLTAREILHAVVPRTRLAVDAIRAGIERGDPGMLNLAAVGEPASTDLALVDLSRRVPAIDAKLR
jgi:8-oxo-dGTP diphosphatase